MGTESVNHAADPTETPPSLFDQADALIQKSANLWQHYDEVMELVLALDMPRPTGEPTEADPKGGDTSSPQETWDLAWRAGYDSAKAELSPDDPGALVGGRSAAPTEMIGPLTAEEWCGFRSTGEDVLQCCAVTSEFRDALFAVLASGGGERWGQILLREPWQALVEHGLPNDPRMEKLRAFYDLDDTAVALLSRSAAEPPEVDEAWLRGELEDVMSDYLPDAVAYQWAEPVARELVHRLPHVFAGQLTAAAIGDAIAEADRMTGAGVTDEQVGMLAGAVAELLAASNDDGPAAEPNKETTRRGVVTHAEIDEMLDKGGHVVDGIWEGDGG